jgi:hypothetical protein
MAFFKSKPESRSESLPKKKPGKKKYCEAVSLSIDYTNSADLSLFAFHRNMGGMPNSRILNEALRNFFSMIRSDLDNALEKMTERGISL